MNNYLPVSFLETQTEKQFNERPRGAHGLTVDNFVSYLREEMPYLKFRSTGTYTTEVAVYREGDAVAWGWISYGDYTSADKINNRFTVYSENIDNAKYRKGSNQRNMAMTTDLGKAVKLAKKHLRPIPLVRVANESMGQINSSYDKSHEAVRRQLDASRNTIMGHSFNRFLHPALEHTLAQLRTQVGQIGNKEFNDSVNTYFSAKDMYLAATQPTGTMFFVHPHMRLGVPIYDTVPISWDRLATMSLPKFRTADFPPPEDMEAVIGRIAVLHMMQSDEFIPGVGMKLDAARYVVVV